MARYRTEVYHGTVSRYESTKLALFILCPADTISAQ